MYKTSFYVKVSISFYNKCNKNRSVIFYSYFERKSISTYYASRIVNEKELYIGEIIFN